MTVRGDHTLKAYDVELKNVATMIAQMGGIAEMQLGDAISAIMRRDVQSATRIIESDAKVDALERQVEEQCIEMLALRQPMASDLRWIIASLRIARDLERIADYAANIAKRSIALGETPAARPVSGLPRMGDLVRAQVRDCLDAFLHSDRNLADQVCRRDEEVDEMYNSLFRVLLTYMMEDPRSITQGAHLLFVAKNIERIGDYATNIAEQVHYALTGELVPDERPKGDETPYLTTASVGPDTDLPDPGPPDTGR